MAIVVVLAAAVLIGLALGLGVVSYRLRRARRDLARANPASHALTETPPEWRPDPDDPRTFIIQQPDLRFQARARRLFGPWYYLTIVDRVSGRSTNVAKFRIPLSGRGSVNRALKYGILRFYSRHPSSDLDLSFLPSDLSSAAIRVGKGRALWPRPMAPEVIRQLAASGHVILGTELRMGWGSGPAMSTKIPWSDFQPHSDDRDLMVATSEEKALAALASPTPSEVSPFDLVLVTWD